MSTSTLQFPANSGEDKDVKWIPATSDVFTVAGLPWYEENNRAFLRLPKRAEPLVRPDVWGLAQNPSGGRVRFKTDSSLLKLRIRHGGGAIAMKHFCSVGCSGIDLYEGPPDRMTFWRSNQPEGAEYAYICTYFENLPKTLREFTLYLPTYCNLAALEIGLDLDAGVAPPTPFKHAKPVAFYGTSITQGGCASRGGNGFVPRLGRMLNCDIVNLGFSGNGRCEPELAALFSEIDAACYVVDAVANMLPETMKTVYPAFVQTLRANRPDRPILLMTRIYYSWEHLAPNSAADPLNRPVFDLYNRLTQEGDKHLHLFDTTQVIGHTPDHPTVDGVHPTDEGFKLLADALAPVLTKLLP